MESLFFRAILPIIVYSIAIAIVLMTDGTMESLKVDTSPQILEFKNS